MLLLLCHSLRSAAFWLQISLRCLSDCRCQHPQILPLPMYGQEATIRPADCHLENHKYTFFGVIFFIIRGRWESILVVGLFAAFCGNLQRSAVDVVPRLIAAVGGRSVRSPNQAVFFSEESCQHPDYCGGVRRSAAECGRVRRSAAELM